MATSGGYRRKPPAKKANKPKRPNTTRKTGMPSTKPRNPGPSRAPKSPSPNTSNPKNVGRGPGNDMGQPKSVATKPKPAPTVTPVPKPGGTPPVAPGPDRGFVGPGVSVSPTYKKQKPKLNPKKAAPNPVAKGKTTSTYTKKTPGPGYKV